jgi:hypothetical protein
MAFRLSSRANALENPTDPSVISTNPEMRSREPGFEARDIPAVRRGTTRTDHWEPHK